MKSLDKEKYDTHSNTKKNKNPLNIMSIVHFPLDMWCDLILANDKRVTCEKSGRVRHTPRLREWDCVWLIPSDALISIICSSHRRQHNWLNFAMNELCGHTVCRNDLVCIFFAFAFQESRIRTYNDWFLKKHSKERWKFIQFSDHN